MDIKIKSMSYEECRENFFVNLIRHAENKIKYWKRQTGYRCELADNLSQAGAEIQYCQDALAALEKQIPKKINEYNRCPCCDTYNEVIEKRKNTVKKDTCYCWHCGQALDWGDT